MDVALPRTDDLLRHERARVCDLKGTACRAKRAHTLGDELREKLTSVGKLQVVVDLLREHVQSARAGYLATEVAFDERLEPIADRRERRRDEQRRQDDRCVRLLTCERDEYALHQA